MLNDWGGAPNPRVEKCLHKLDSEIVRYQSNERRSVHRNPFTRPVTVEYLEEGELFQAFSQNISSLGIGLLSDKPIKDGQMAVLHIHSTEGPPFKILSESRWCRPFGEGWFCSGWNFVALPREKPVD